jgi:hypothetical protein
MEAWVLTRFGMPKCADTDALRDTDSTILQTELVEINAGVDALRDSDALADGPHPDGPPLNCC